MVAQATRLRGAVRLVMVMINDDDDDHDDGGDNDVKL